MVFYTFPNIHVKPVVEAINDYERPYMHHKVIFEKARIYQLLYLLFNCINAISYLNISYLLFPVDLVTKRAMLEVARRVSSPQR